MSVKVTVDVTDTSGYVNTSTDRVVFRAKNTIGAASVAGRVISTAPVVVELRGETQEVNLEPGPHVVTIRARGYDDNEFHFTVPDDVQELTLRDLLENHFDYDPEKIAEAQRYAVQAKGSADAAAASEARLGLAETIVENTSSAAASAATATTEADRAKTEADRATTKADNSATEAGRSKTEADRAEAAATTTATDTADLLDGFVTQATTERLATQNAAASADTYKTEAKTSADAAAASATTATDKASSASAYATTADNHRNAAVAAQTGAEDARDAASVSANSAATSAGTATDKAAQATQAANTAANDVRQSVATDADRAEDARDAAETYRDDASTARDDAQAAAASAAEVVSTGVPDATTTVKGKVLLAGDLSGTAEAPTVPGLSTKVTQSGQANRVYGTGSGGTETTYPLDGSAPTPNSVAYRTATGALPVGVPTADAHAATKKYVDDALAPGVVKITGDQSIAGVKNFATAPQIGGVTVVKNDDSRLTDTRTPKSHTHAVADVTGLQSALDGKVSTVTDASRVYGTSSAGAQTAYLLGGSNAASGTVPLRVTGGAINTGEPTSGSHATTKAYVDSAVASVSAVASAALPAAQIQVVTAMPASPVAGTVYYVTGA